MAKDERRAAVLVLGFTGFFIARDADQDSVSEHLH